MATNLPFDQQQLIALGKALEKGLDITKAKNFLTSQLGEYMFAVKRKLDHLTQIDKIIKALNDKGNTLGKRYIYGLLRRYVNLVSKAMHKYGYIIVEIFGRYEINRYIRYLQKAGYVVNPIKAKINIAQLHKRVYGFIDSMDIKLSNLKLFATSTRVTVLETASPEVRTVILRTFRENRINEFYGKTFKRVYPYDMESASLEKQAQVLHTKLRSIGFGEKINVSNSPTKKIYKDLYSYAKTWARDIQRQASVLTTTHLCEASAIELVQWLANPNCCDECSTRDNKIYSLDPNNKDYEYFSDDFFHPNDKCAIVPYDDVFDDLNKEMKEYYQEDKAYTKEEIETVREAIINAGGKVK